MKTTAWRNAVMRRGSRLVLRPLLSLGFVLSSFLLLPGAGCSKRVEPAPTATLTPTPTGDRMADRTAEGALMVFAASSLREGFTAIEGELTKTHPGARVTFNFAGSQELRAQIEHGAPADVFASADTRHMDDLRLAGRVDGAAIFAHNDPVIVVAAEKAGTVHSLADLASVGRLVIGAPDVPIGRYTLQIFDKAARLWGGDWRAKVESRVVSRELNVRQVLAKVGLGEADAGIVYRTDAVAAPAGVTVVAIPPELDVIADYPIAVVANAPHPALARAFVALVLSTVGQDTLKQRGFLAGAVAGDGGGGGGKRP